MTWLCALWWWSRCGLEQYGLWSWEWYGGYNGIWEIRCRKCLIGFTSPRVGVSIQRIGSLTGQIGNCELTQIQNSRMIQPLKMICYLDSSLSLTSSNQPSHKHTKLGHPSLSLDAMNMSQHRVQLTPSTVYGTMYSIHRVLRHPKINCLLLPASLSSINSLYCTQLATFPQFHVNEWIQSWLPFLLRPDLPPRDQLPRDQLHRSTAPISIYYGLQVYLKPCLITASKSV